MTNLGEKLKAARNAQRITQQALADRLGVHRSTIANYEIERRRPSLAELKELSQILHVDLNYLLEGSEVSAETELKTRANDVFNSLDISVEDKDAIFRDIMEIYMRGKMDNASSASAERNNKKRL